MARVSDPSGEPLPWAAVDLIRRAEALVFDVDGTLVESHAIKWRAFEDRALAQPSQGGA